MKIIASGDLGWDLCALGRLDELGPAAESIEWHSPDSRQRTLFERSRPGLKFVPSGWPDCGLPDKSLPFMGTPPAQPLGRLLVPDAERVAAYRAALPNGPLAGLIWGCGPTKRGNPLQELAPFVGLGYTFICPQLVAPAEELEELRALGLDVVRPDDYEPASSLEDQVALFELCRFVVGTFRQRESGYPVCEGALVPAALGKPTYIIGWEKPKAGALRWFENASVLALPEPPALPSKWTPLVTDLCSRLESGLAA